MFKPLNDKPTLSVALGAIQANYHILAERLAQSRSSAAAVVKANAYGLGARPVAAALAQAGARVFFVATLDEGVELRELLPDRAIYILGGLPEGSEALVRARRLVPVLNRLDEVKRWSHAARNANTRLPAAIHVDTGMARLGLDASELEALRDAPELLEAFSTRLYMSHLASAETPGAHNLVQLGLLQDMLNGLPPGWVSLANSSGIFLSEDYHYDLARPGAALYGINPRPDTPNPMQPVVGLDAPVLQVRTLAAGDSVGYGSTWSAQAPSRIATLGLGYADGLFRSLSNQGEVRIAGQICPIVGRVSMDLISVDVTHLAETETQPGVRAHVLDSELTADSLAAKAGTIGYEILTSLGQRFARVYKEGLL